MDTKGLNGLYRNWIDSENKSSQAKDLQPDRLGVFRGGNVGCVGAKGEIYGECPRTCLARSWGYSGTVDDDKHLMFDSGKGNETLWDNRFIAALGKDNLIPEGDPRSVLSWTLPSGRMIGGSPDGIIIEGGNKTLLEYKRISSAWTARTIRIKRKPKKQHPIQAFHYMGASNIANGLLIYTQDVNFSCPTVGGMDAKVLWPEDSGEVQYKNDYPFNTLPTIVAFDLQLDGDGIGWIKHQDDEEWTKTLISTQGIYNFYDMVDKQEIEGVLAAKPTRKSPFGAKGDNASPCEYCDFKSLCENKSLSFSEFKSHVESKIKSD